MSVTSPIRSKEDIEGLKKYFLERKEYRNYLFLVMGLNTALRTSDILKLRWSDIIRVNENGYDIKRHIEVIEQKTQKYNKVFINDAIREAIDLYLSKNEPKEYVFDNKRGGYMSRFQAYKIIKRAAEYLKLEGNISCHSLRKTFGFHAWKNGVPTALLMQIYNHSSYSITKRYLGIMQEDKDDVFNKIKL